MKLRLLLPLFVVLLFLAACSPPPELRSDTYLDDTSLLSDDPCSAPCWRNIVPGETLWRDARIIVEDDNQLVDIEVVEDENSAQRLLGFKQRDGAVCCQLFSSSDGEIINSMLILLKPQMVLSELLDKYGDPAFAAGDDVTPDQTVVTLIYPDVPMLIHVFGEGIESGSLNENSDIIGMTYLTDVDMEAVLRDTDYYEWEGYVDLKAYLDGEFDHTAEVTEEAPDAESEE